MRDSIDTRMCGGCGYIHPPPWDNSCPIALEQNTEQTEKGQKIVDLCSSLSKFLHTRDDYDKFIVSIREIIKKYSKR